VLLFSIKPRYYQADTLSAKAVPIGLLVSLSAGLETLMPWSLDPLKPFPEKGAC